MTTDQSPSAEVTYTNSSLSAFRRCPRLYELSYLQLLKPETQAEALAVGSAWHRAFEFEDPEDGIVFLRERSPSPLWGEKLVRLFAAYKLYWRTVDHPLNDANLVVVETEQTFRVEFHGITLEGQIDAKAKLPDGRIALVERKSTSDAVDDDSPYWNRLRMATQPGVYAIALAERPSVIVYDVMHKPTINPKRLLKKDVASLTRQAIEGESAVYCGELIPAGDVASGLAEERETLRMYGARLAKDIAERPEKYFARREISRTARDYEALMNDLEAQIGTIEALNAADEMSNGNQSPFYRNPDACDAIGTCSMFGLCERGENPRSCDPPPRGYIRRAHRHAELVKDGGS